MPELSNKNCIIYCRVSSKEQEDRGYSLEAQEKLLTEYAERNGLKTARLFKISESASGKQIRKTFNEMLSFVKQKKIDIILCEKIDRLTRNLKDGAVVSDWVTGDENRQVHFVKENFVVSKNTRAHENLVWDMKVAIARFYTNNLSEEVKKGQIAKLESGWIPCGQKFGYKTIGEKGHKTQTPDENSAPFIRKAFELYSSGNYTISRLTETMRKEGMKNRSGKEISRSILHTVLSDPFYCGIISWRGQEYEGKHEPIITRELFNNVKIQMSRIYKNGQMKIHSHLFKGLIKCGGCGCLITWETQKGHHYGHCKGFKPCEEKGYIRQEEIEKALIENFERIKPGSDKVLDWVKKALREAHKDKKSYSASTRESLNKNLELIENRLDKIYDDKIDGVITIEYYKKRFNEYNEQKRAIVDRLSGLENNFDNYYETGVKIHDLAYTAKESYLDDEATVEEKRILINKIFSELKLKGKELVVEYTPAYQFLSEWIPKLNTTSELLKTGEYYEKTGSFEPAHPCLLPGSDSNRRPTR